MTTTQKPQENIRGMLLLIVAAVIFIYSAQFFLNWYQPFKPVEYVIKVMVCGFAILTIVLARRKFK